MSDKLGCLREEWIPGYWDLPKMGDPIPFGLDHRIWVPGHWEPVPNK